MAEKVPLQYWTAVTITEQISKCVAEELAKKGTTVSGFVIKNNDGIKVNFFYQKWQLIKDRRSR